MAGQLASIAFLLGLLLLLLASRKGCGQGVASLFRAYEPTPGAGADAGQQRR